MNKTRSQNKILSIKILDVPKEWPSVLKHCDQNRKVPSSNPTRHSAGLRDPTSL